MSGDTAGTAISAATAPQQKRGGMYSLLLRDSVIYGGGRMLQKFLNALLLPLYTSYLTPQDYGVLGIVLVTVTLIDVIVTLGFDAAFARFYFDDKTDLFRNKVVTGVFYVDTVYPLVLLGAMAVFMPQISRVLMRQDGFALYFSIALIGEFFINWADLAFQLFRLEHRPWVFTFYNLGRILIQVPLTVVLVVVFRMGVLGVLVGNAVTSFVICMASLPTYWRRLSVRVDTDLLRRMAAFAVPAVFTGLIFFILKLSDRFFLLRYRGGAEVGLYTTAFALSQPVYLAAMAFRMAWPQWHFARLNEPERHKQLVARSSTYFILVCASMVVGIGVFMPLVVRLLLRNPAYWSVGPTTFVLSLGTVVYSLYFVFWVGANVAKKNRLIPVITAVASGVNVAANIVFIPKYGMIAAAWTTFAGFSVLAALMLPISHHYYPIRFEWLRFVKIAVASGVALAAAWAMGRATGESVRMPLEALVPREALKLAAFLLLPLVLLLTGFFTAGERRAAAAALSKAARLLGVHRLRDISRRTRPRAGPPRPHELDQQSRLAEDDELELELAARIDIVEGGDQSS